MQSTVDPAALQMLSSLATELDALEAAAARMRARLDTLIDFLAPEPVVTMDPENTRRQAQANSQSIEELGAEAFPEDGADVSAPVGTGLTSSGDETFNSAECADVTDADAAVIGLCACIEASVAEFAAAAEVAREPVDLGDAEKAIPEAAALAEDHGHDGEPAAVAEAGGVEAGEAVFATEEPKELQAANDAVQVAEAVAIDAAASQVAADGSTTDEATAAVVALDPTPVASNVVAIKLKRRVWPQLMTACASVLLIAAAALVVAMPELVGFTI